MSDHRIVVHIGIPKTGSSSLQHFLTLNRDALNKYGYDYPDLNHTFNSDMAYTGRWMNSGRLYLSSGDLQRFKKYLDELDYYITKYNVILSDEGIYAEGHQFLEILKKRYKNLYLIVYLRRQDTLIESEYGQRIKASIIHPEWVKEGYDVISLNDLVDKVLQEQTDITEMLHYSVNLKRLSDIVGDEGICVRLFEDVVKDGLYRSFIRTINLGYDDFEDTDNINVSKSALETEVKRRLNLFARRYPAPLYKICNDIYRKRILEE